MNSFVRNILLSAVSVALVANILWQIPWENFRRPTQTEIERAQTWDSKNILPTPSNILAMERQWRERISTMPPDQRKVSEARLREESKFFMEVQLLPAAERKIAVKERIQALMNDPGIQADWAGERMKILAGTSPERRRELLKKYVESKMRRSQTE